MRLPSGAHHMSWLSPPPKPERKVLPPSLDHIGCTLRTTTCCVSIGEA
jgi:hypothetical protein